MFLTLGILSGAVWANETWGTYWSWDPKETWALITWLTFAAYLHTRLLYGWQGVKPASIASLGFILVWVCYLGVNLLGKGLHSYGFLANLFKTVSCYVSRFLRQVNLLINRRTRFFELATKLPRTIEISQNA